MLISHRKEFIYTKTAKTAGTSVEVYFEQYCMPEGEWVFSHGREEHVSEAGIIGYRGTSAKGKQWRNHMSAAEIRDRIGASIWNRYFKFCVIRNPFDKLVSAFFFLNKDYEGEDLINNFRNWIKRGGTVIDRDKYLIGGEICVDYFIRYENLEHGIMHVCDLLNLPFEPDRIPKLKSGLRNKGIPTRDFYDKETIKIVSSVYNLEFQLFKYSMP